MFTVLFMLNCYCCGDFFPVLHTTKDKDRMAWLAEVSDLLYEVEQEGWGQVQTDSRNADHYICPSCIEDSIRQIEKSL